MALGHRCKSKMADCVLGFRLQSTFEISTIKKNLCEIVTTLSLPVDPLRATDCNAMLLLMIKSADKPIHPDGLMQRCIIMN